MCLGAVPAVWRGVDPSIDPIFCLSPFLSLFNIKYSEIVLDGLDQTRLFFCFISFKYLPLVLLYTHILIIIHFFVIIIIIFSL